MIGGSYDGTTANMVAARGADAPGLAAIVPELAISRWYGYAYADGVRYLGNSERPTDEGFDTPLAFDFGIARTPPTQRTPQTVDAMRDRMNPCDAPSTRERGYDTLARLRRLLARARLPQGRRELPRVHARRARLAGLQRQAVRGRRPLRGAAAADDAPRRARRSSGSTCSRARTSRRPGARTSTPLLDEFFDTTLRGAAPGPELAAPVLTQGRTAAAPGDFRAETRLAARRRARRSGSRSAAAWPAARSAAAGGGPAASFTDLGTTTEETAHALAGRRAGLARLPVGAARGRHADRRHAAARALAHDRPGPRPARARRSSTSRPTAPPRRSRAAS